ncbi:hypothetical protein B0H14DRAFT_3872539 [Mycena olivaceomarginata]|nr:hypothetical protein B0H14DRAFT_3872539 [Mycena olivaceomarginata]
MLMHMKLSIAAGLPYDLVLGRDWLFFCRETLLLVSFNLPSGIVGPRQQSNAVFLSQTFCGMVDMVDVPAQCELSIAYHYRCSSTHFYQPLDVDASAMNLWFAAVLLRPFCLIDD